MKFKDLRFPALESHYHAMSTNHREQTGRENYAIIVPSLSHDGTMILCGIIRKNRAQAYVCVAYQLATKRFEELTFDESLTEFDFELSLPDATALYDINQKYQQNYRIKCVESSTSSVSSQSSVTQTRSAGRNDIVEIVDDEVNLDSLFMDSGNQSSKRKRGRVCYTEVVTLKSNLSKASTAESELKRKNTDLQNNEKVIKKQLKTLQNDTNKKTKALDESQSKVNALMAEISGYKTKEQQQQQQFTLQKQQHAVPVVPLSNIRTSSSSSFNVEQIKEIVAPIALMVQAPLALLVQQSASQTDALRQLESTNVALRQSETSHIASLTHMMSVSDNKNAEFLKLIMDREDKHQANFQKELKGARKERMHATDKQAKMMSNCFGNK